MAFYLLKCAACLFENRSTLKGKNLLPKGTKQFRVTSPKSVLIPLSSQLSLLYFLWDIWPRLAKPCLRAHADSEGPDKPAHPRSLIRAFTVRLQNYWIPQNVRMKSKGPDDILRMRMMMQIRTFCTCLKVLFRLTQPNYDLYLIWRKRRWLKILNH